MFPEWTMSKNTLEHGYFPAHVLSDSFEYDFHSEPSGLTFISEKSEINDDFGKIRPCLVAGGAQ